MFFITALQKIEPSKEWLFDFGGQRTFGYYETFEDAVYAVNHNVCDLHEYLYEYCLIEELEPGIHPTCTKESRTLYKWDTEKRGFFLVPEPPEMECLINFALG